MLYAQGGNFPAYAIIYPDKELEEATKALQESRKRARNCGEDLLEDTLALDKLTGLFPEDRSNRKAAIAALDSLLEEVDTIKSDLTRVGKDLEAKLEAQRNGVCKSETLSKKDPSDNVALAGCMDTMLAEEPGPIEVPEPIETQLRSEIRFLLFS